MSDAARRLRELSQKVVTLPAAGVEVTIQKIDQTALVERGGPLLMAAREGGSVEGHEADVARAMRLLLVLALVDPPVWEGTSQTCPEGFITPGMVGEDYAWLVNEIMAFNGMTAAAADAAESFRAALRGDAGSDSSALPSAPNDDSGPDAVPNDAAV